MSRETKQFCRECNNMLYPKEDKQEKVLYLACRNCEHFEEAVTPMVYSVQYKNESGAKGIAGISAMEIASDPTLKRIRTKECTRCGGRVHAYFQSKDHNEDTSLADNHVCCNCFKIESSLG
ncbi:DNA-directed RNA polymerase II subunit RPB9 [Nematocida homosporus]|uniref:DNA-directed RNA polymerase II subunit RPB9 n=1 Tax=Nematocida homosporus TaxID=1912981 RepID=UPI002221244E|nr:DNA-directed RNA polymerase II subunit RPB9 [Nematocida homosporus]KAI5184728.1 DNA-directed RNA polymerase II subunit RPB9 [Nematocida homosporus]